MVCKVRRNPEVLSELFDKELEKEEQKKSIRGVIKEMINKDKFIDSAELVKQ